MANKLDNLKKAKPFKKNDPRINKKGRPPKLPHLDELLAKVLGEEKDGKTAAEAIIMALRAKAARGDVRAAEVLLDRGWGKVKERVDLTTGDNPLSGEDLSKLTTDELVALSAMKKKMRS